MEGDKELENLRNMKLKEMLEKSEKGSVSNKPIEVSDASFTETIRSYPLVVIDCWAEWCGPCRMIAPIIEEIARDYAGKILFGKLNVDENQEIPRRYRVMSIPTLLVFKNGQLVDQIIGAMPRQALEPRIVNHL